MPDETPSNLKNYLNPVKVLPAAWKGLGEGLKEFKRGDNIFEKVSLFFGAFWKEIKAVGAEKHETTEKAKKAAKKTTEETMAAARETVNIEGLEGEQKDAFDEARSSFVMSLKSLNEDDEGTAHDGLSKLEQAAAGGTPAPLDYNEKRTVAGVALITFRQLKDLCGNPAAFKKKLDEIVTAAPNVSIAGHKADAYLGENVLSLFDFPEGTEGDVQMASLVFSLNINPAIAITDKWGDKLAPLSQPNMTAEQLNEMLPIFGQHFFPATAKMAEDPSFSTKSKVDPNSPELVKKYPRLTRVILYLNKLITKKGALDTESLSQIMFALAPADVDRFINALVPNRDTVEVQSAA